jgi:hypothetical protein
MRGRFHGILLLEVHSFLNVLLLRNVQSAVPFAAVFRPVRPALRGPSAFQKHRPAPEARA